MTPPESEKKNLEFLVSCYSLLVTKLATVQPLNMHTKGMCILKTPNFALCANYLKPKAALFDPEQKESLVFMLDSLPPQGQYYRDSMNFGVFVF